MTLHELTAGPLWPPLTIALYSSCTILAFKHTVPFAYPHLPILQASRLPSCPLGCLPCPTLQRPAVSAAVHVSYQTRVTLEFLLIELSIFPQALWSASKDHIELALHSAHSKGLSDIVWWMSTQVSLFYQIFTHFYWQYNISLIDYIKNDSPTTRQSWVFSFIHSL